MRAGIRNEEGGRGHNAGMVTHRMVDERKWEGGREGGREGAGER